MYKIEFIPTGHIFELPDITAKELKEKFPEDYKILEKNVKKYRDKIKKRKISDSDSIYELVVEKEKRCWCHSVQIISFGRDFVWNSTAFKNRFLKRGNP